MKKDIFTTWIREFCSLVFIQTIQAFIFSIVMALIISVMTPDNITGIDRADVISATGFIAVIALASISKIEDLVKKIFGVQSSVTDPSMRGGMKSLASTLVAAKLAKGVLDNGKKMAGGIGGVFAANKKIRVAKTRYARDLNRKLGNGNPSSGTGNATVASVDSGGGSSASTTVVQPTARDYMNKAIEAKKAGDVRGYYQNRGIAAGMMKQSNMQSASNNNIAAATAGGNIAGGLNASKLSNKDKIELDKMRDTFDDKMSDLKSQRMESGIKAVSGLIESAGALVGRNRRSFKWSSFRRSG